MRVFKHGDAIAIVIPDSLAKKSSLREGEELEFFEVEPRVFILASKQKIAELAKNTFYPKQTTAPESVLKKTLFAKGFLSIENEFQAREASREFAKEISSRAVLSATSFDKRNPSGLPGPLYSNPIHPPTPSGSHQPIAA